MENNKKAEFDDWAKDYQYGFDNPIKKLLGHNPDDFLDIKIRWLADFLITNYPEINDKKIDILDFGCGTGLFLKKINDLNFNLNLSGADVSEKMLQAAKNIINEKFSHCLYLLLDDFNVPSNNLYDLIIISSVLHHIDKKQRQNILNDLSHLLKENGCLIIFEHNPSNPITKWVVKNTKIDQNAVLLKPKEILDYFKKTGLVDFIKIDYLMFFPPRFSNQIIQLAERKLARIPIGAQYVIVGKKSNT